ncbi:MAG: VC_2705 family sodium/solute symporter [Rhodoferax sp.]|nr:VC_2705 family sodium/solute symporter [Rhodoferax sp.]MDP3653674.1 VC_2705 family sodium/solute symporter [Rhodoferax sp.]
MTDAVATRPWRLHAGLLVLWFAVSFGAVFFARDLQVVVAGWPLGFWLSAQGAVLVFIAIVVVFAWVSNRREPSEAKFDQQAYVLGKRKLHRRFAIYVVSLLLFLLGLALAERLGLSKAWVAGIFLSATLVMYAVIGVYGRTADAAEYYVAGRRIPAVYNGMATAADWMSAASFISLAGGLYLQGYSGVGAQSGGLVYILGWTGGFCLVALWVAPYLRRMRLYTVPDYFSVRFGGRWPRMIAALAAVLCSFTYVVAQLYGVGLITARLTGVHFEIGILLGLGGVLVCSFLGGMRAVTWTQVTQYVVIILAFLIPVSWLAYKQIGNPFAPLAYGQQLQKIATMEQRLADSPAEQQVIDEYGRRARVLERKLQDIDGALQTERQELRSKLRAMGDINADDERANALRRELAAVPKDANSARERWSRDLVENQERAKPLGGMPPHTMPFAGNPTGSLEERALFETSRLNFLALMFCLMVGTAGLPHLLTRYYTTPTVAEARSSVAWSLVFIALLYLSAPALAVLVKYEVMAHLVGQPFDDLPSWVAQWARDPSLLSLSDVNGDHILQFAELKIGADLVMLATPEIGGLPYVVSVLVAAGGLAAALSTADGLLLTIGNAIAHDVYFEGDSDKAQAMRRVMWSKFALLVVALIAAYVAAQRPAGILYLVSASFSLAGAAFVPAMVLGIFWRGTTHAGAVGGMLAGLGVTVYYMAVNLPVVRSVLGLTGDGLWWGIQPISAGVFGVAAGLLATVFCSLLTQKIPAPDQRAMVVNRN